MKGIFKKMKGRVGKKGSSLIAVMTAMAVLSIVALCAASIAITNYRTTQTYKAQDNYYYSAEAGQAQFVSNINDVAYSVSSDIVWNYDNTESYKSSATQVYNEIIQEAEKFQEELEDTLYNGEYKVKNEIVSAELSDDYSECVITIKTTVTNTTDGSTQEFMSTATIKFPSKDGESAGTTTDIIKVAVTEDTDFFNTGYALVTDGSGKNTDWYGIWAGFNTYYTKNHNNAPYIGNGATTTKNLNVAGKVFTTESTKPSNSASSGIMLKAGITSSAANNPGSSSWYNHVNPNSIFDGAASRIEGFFEGIDINITGTLEGVKNSNEVTKVTGNKITLAYGSTVMSKDEKFYAKYDGDFTINFATTPKNQGTVNISSLPAGTFDGTQPAYRVVCNQNGSSFGIGYKYTDKNGSKKSNVPYSYTYADHYYKNKWFFLDLGGDGTLRIENSTTTDRSWDTSIKFWLWFPIIEVKNYTCTDGWGISNYVSFGNIVMEDCYFFVNGNIDIANAYNMSNCKFFATGDILLEKVYYLEGLLSLETEAGSDIIKQSLYYCDGVFRSELVSRYAMAWATHNECSSSGALLTYGQPQYQLMNPSGNDVSFTSWQTAWTECLIPNENTYEMTTSVMYYWVMYPIYTNGYLATYRYPTVLKATIIANGTTSFTPKQTTYNNSTSTSPSAVSDVSVILNPDGDGYGVVDAVLIEGQVFSRGKIYTTNYNGKGAFTNRYGASSQIQYQPYTGGYDIGTEPSIEDVFEKIEIEVSEGTTSVTYSPIIIENSGIFKN